MTGESIEIPRDPTPVTVLERCLAQCSNIPSRFCHGVPVNGPRLVGARSLRVHIYASRSLMTRRRGHEQLKTAYVGYLQGTREVVVQSIMAA